jgi:ribonuclease HI
MRQWGIVSEYPPYLNIKLKRAIIMSYFELLDKGEIRELWVSGSITKNPSGTAGYAIVHNYVPLKSEVCPEATSNNAVELVAIREALRFGAGRGLETIYSSSNYAVKGLMHDIQHWSRNDWKKTDGKPIKNKELVMRITC